MAERAVQAFGEQFRVIREGLQQRLQVSILGNHPLTSWMTEHSADLLNKYQCGEDGRTAYRRWKGKDFQGQVVEFGEKVHHSEMQKPIQRVKFTKAVACHSILDQNPSIGYICPGEPHQRSPNVPKFEDRSLEETEWQEQGAFEAAWKLAKSFFQLKEHERAAFFSSPENRCLPASIPKPEEREFVVDSGASMHMISKKDLSKAEMKSCSPTIVITANGEVQTHEEAIVYVKELDILDNESPRKHASSIVARKALR